LRPSHCTEKTENGSKCALSAPVAPPKNVVTPNSPGYPRSRRIAAAHASKSGKTSAKFATYCVCPRSSSLFDSAPCAGTSVMTPSISV